MSETDERVEEAHDDVGLEGTSAEALKNDVGHQGPRRICRRLETGWSYRSLLLQAWPESSQGCESFVAHLILGIGDDFPEHVYGERSAGPARRTDGRYAKGVPVLRDDRSHGVGLRQRAMAGKRIEDVARE